MSNLADALTAEIKRMNEEIIPCYVEIIPSKGALGFFEWHRSPVAPAEELLL